MRRRPTRLRLLDLEARTVPAAGALDLTFGPEADGLSYVWAGMSQGDRAGDLLLLPDGKIVLAGAAAAYSNNTSPVLFRLDADGSLDDSFSGDGLVVVPLPNATGSFGQVLRQADGKLLAVGSAETEGHARLLLARFNEDGTLDDTFGVDGIVIGEIPGQLGYAATLDADGKIIIGGSHPSGGSFGTHLLVQRFNADGSIDTPFGGGDGRVTLDLGPTDPVARTVIVQDDGKIVAAGSTSSSGGNFSFVVVRMNADGSPDTSFDTDGVVRTSPPNTAFQSIAEIIQLPEGKLLAAGGVGLGQNYTGTPTILRYNTDGSLDTAFNGIGYVHTYLGGDSDIGGLIAQDDGKYLAVGSIGIAGGSKSTVIRYNPDGSLDTGFGPAGQVYEPGVVVTDTAPGNNDGYVAVELLPDGRILTAGTVGGGNNSQLVVGRYIADATLAAVDDEYTVDEDETLSVDATEGVYANDFALVGSPTVELVAGPAHSAQFTLNADGSFTYQPAADFVGTDTFTYRLVDGAETSGTATVVIHVEGTTPLAADDAFPATEDEPLTVTAANGVTSNDSLFGNLAEVQLVDGPAHALQFTLNADGSFTYQATANFHGTDSFTYRLVGAAGTSEIATVALTIQSVNDAPTADDDAYTIVGDSPFTVDAITGVLANDADIEGDALHATIVDQPAVGTVVLSADGSFTYTFPDDLTESVTFTYVVTDGLAVGNVATVTLTREMFTITEGARLRVFSSGNDDIVRLVRDGKSIIVEIQSPTGLRREVVTPAAGTKRFTSLELNLGEGDDRIDASKWKLPLRIVGGLGNDVIRTGRASDIVFGDNEDGSGTGNNTIDTGGGHDRIVAGHGLNEILAGTGNDTIVAGNGGNYVDAGAGNDFVTTGGGRDWILGGGGQDVLDAGDGDDLVDGGGANDLLIGGLGADVLEGTSGNDILVDGRMTVTNPASDTLAQILKSYKPSKRPALLPRFTVTLDAATDTLHGGTGTDWFWSSNDDWDRSDTEPLNATN